jgi:hypothetical protein
MRMMRTLLGDILGADPQTMTTPELVREFARKHLVSNEREHERHQTIVTELRRRGVLD